MPRYKLADDTIREIADDLIQDSSKHLGHLQTCVVNIILVDMWKGKKALQYGEVRTVTGLHALRARRMLSDREFTDPSEAVCHDVFINNILWSLLKTETTKRMAMYHTLLHLSSDEDGKITVREPDFRLFTEEVALFGEDLPNVQRIQELLRKRDGQEELAFEDSSHGGEEADDEEDTTEPDVTLRQLPMPGFLSLAGVNGAAFALPAPPRAALPAPPVDAIEGEFRVEGEETKDERLTRLLVEPPVEEQRSPDPFDEVSDEEHAALMERLKAREIGATDKDVRPKTRRRIPANKTGATA